MSHSPTDAGKPQPNSQYESGWKRITERIESGGSWSGRERNCCFLNTGTKPFADISAISGLDYKDDGRAVAVVDWDGDGDLDLWISNRTAPRLRFLRNESAAHHRRLSLRLRGTRCNRDAIGARVELHLAGGPPTRRIKTLHAGDGFLAQSSKLVHFGLGTAAGIDRVVVRWPGGNAEEFRGLKAGGTYRLVQDSGRAVLEPPRGPIDLASAQQKHPAASGFVRLPLMQPLPLPALQYTGFDGVARPLESTGRAPLLLNLWASWCVPCAHELAEFKKEFRRCEAQGLQIVALSVDGLNEGGNTTQADAQRLLKRLKLPFTTGMANRELLDKLDVLLDTVASTRTRIDNASSLPVPASLLLDASGRLAVIYKGRVSVETVLADLNTLKTSSDPLASLAVPFTGRWFLRPGFNGNVVVRFADRFIRRGYPDVAQQYLSVAEETAAANGYPFGADQKLASAHIEIGNRFLRKNRVDDAESHFRGALRVRPGSSTALTNLGNIELRRGRLAEAVRHYRAALKTDPRLLRPRINLASVALQQRRYAEAETELRTLLVSHPRYAPAHNYLGLVLVSQGRNTEAIAEFTKAVRLDPGYVDARNNLQKFQTPLRDNR